ncbi:protein serine/threonine kinase [Tieghemostelium lacteum]|uniref:Protein serine/threonine kinase n=1 Tax=Tieghemostelium lacteum TaxID=361077 RepID=A0A151Z680_TIELA|nr:protein serine/threonine kinase [Tieghemostelium lacteum]|eukprot:KYQ89471.1 protein serine/threonine kinase [Tieghemostelium lacteum]
MDSKSKISSTSSTVKYSLSKPSTSTVPYGGMSDESAMRMVYGSSSTSSREERTKEKLEVIKLTFKAIRSSECVDLLFLIDCTGSMGPYINQVKKDITRLQENLKIKHSNLDMMFGFIRYTDFDMGSNNHSVLQFTRSTEEFVNFASKISAMGGGDDPEDVFGGMNLMKSMNWRTDSTRVVIHIADAPCHGSEYHSMQDSHASGDPNGIRLVDLMNSINALNLNYYFGHIDLSSTGKMIDIFDKSLKFVSKNQKSISSFDSKDTSTLNEKIFNSVSESISITKSMLTAKFSGTIATPTTERDFKIDAIEPNWADISGIIMLQKTFHLPSNLKTCLEPTYDMRLNEITSTIKMAPNPFSQGAFRLAYYGINEHGKKIVLKQSKLIGGGHNSLKTYYQAMECQTIAAKFGIEFNAVRGKKEITFTIAKVLQVKSSETPTYYGLETYIEGKYEKYNSNAGWKSDNPETAIFQTFSHWTYNISNGKAMVIDIQGVKTSKGYILTDPCIHSEDVLRFGPTNLGKGGMIKFFETHVCNKHCSEMGLTLPPFVKDIKKTTATTTTAHFSGLSLGF